MSSIFKTFALQMLRDEGIDVKKSGEIYYGDKNFILPVLVDEGIFYFKFFMDPIEEHIEAEVSVVEYLKENGIEVPDFYCKDNKKIFYSGENMPFKTIFYASKHVNADKDKEHEMSTEEAEDIIKNIARMHLKLKKFDKSSVKIDKTTDYQRLIQLYIDKKDLCDERNISEKIERVIEYGTDKVETYPIHSDLHSANIMMKNGKFKSFIDFSDVRDSYFEDDLGKFFQNLLGSKGVKMSEMHRLIAIYEQETGITLSRKNIYTSTIYRIMDRYFWKLSRGVRDTDYDIKINGIIEDLIHELEKIDREIKDNDKERE